jgi:tetratricopeptide (TPR) repeat protein
MITKIVGFITTLVCVLGFVLLAVASNFPPKKLPLPKRLPSGFAGSDQCMLCHADLYRSYQNVAMARSLYKPTRENVIESYSTNNKFFHAKSGYYYEMSERGGKFYQKRYLRNADGKQVRVQEEEITYIIGSGNHARSYLRHHADGRITELPISWYSQEKRWYMSPGYDFHRHADFSREIIHDCVFCHNSYPRLIPETASNEKFFPYELPLGIDCERCHGPAAEHIALVQANASRDAIHKAIFHPGRAPKQLQRDLCYQCHFVAATQFAKDRIFKPDRDVFSYRPGERLSNSIINLDYADKDRPLDEFKILHQGYRLEQSACFQMSRGEMTCTSCHNPHKVIEPENKVSYFRSKCLQCHKQDACKEIHTTRQRENDDCAACHMWKRRPEDAVHTIFTDHKIQRVKPKGNFLAPLSEVSPLLSSNKDLILHGPQELTAYEEKFFLGTAYLKLPPEQITMSDEQRAKGMRLLEQFVKEVETFNGQAKYLSRAFYILGDIYRRQGLRDRALDAFQRSAEYDPTFGLVYNNWGALFAELGQTQQAVETLQKGLDSNPWDAMIYRNLGSLFAWQNSMDQAIELFKRCLAIDPDNVGAYHYLGNALAAKASYEEAIGVYEKALDLQPQNPALYWDCAVSLLKLGRNKESLEYIQNGLRYAPGHPRGKELLRTVQFSTERDKFKTRRK